LQGDDHPHGKPGEVAELDIAQVNIIEIAKVG